MISKERYYMKNWPNNCNLFNSLTLIARTITFSCWHVMQISCTLIWILYQIQNIILKYSESYQWLQILTNFSINSMTRHTKQFLKCWHIIEREVQPTCIINNIGDIIISPGNNTPHHPCAILLPSIDALSYSPSSIRYLAPHHRCVILLPIIHALSYSPSYMRYLTPIIDELSYSPSSIRYLTPNHPCVILLPIIDPLSYSRYTCVIFRPIIHELSYSPSKMR